MIECYTIDNVLPIFGDSDEKKACRRFCPSVPMLGLAI